ncbi:MAG TPA: TIGR00730 family Rossman fold protein [Bacteroidota bacterium]|jgi:hypothetical protein
MPLKKVCVYAASSKQIHPEYLEDAREAGEELAKASIEIVYGGGAVGLMGAIADGALSRKGRVTGIIPRFMMDLEWGHPDISEMVVVEDMHQRKARMIEESDAVLALPGGCGTLEELFEAITMKRLGLYFKPIILLNTRGAYDRVVDVLEHCVEERFMDDRHRGMWRVASTPAEIIPAIHQSPLWPENARSFATF